MPGYISLYKIFFLWVSLAAMVLASREDNPQNFMHHLLRMTNPDNILNSVLGRLEMSRAEILEALTPKLADDADCEDPENLPEYTEALDGSSERGLRHLGSQKHYPICHLERKIHRLNTEEYEYRPAYYEEVRCIMSSSDEVGVRNEVCSSLGFSCIQWNKTIHLTRRQYSSECWETKTMVIPAGCECMWPVHRLGEITLHA